MNCDGLIPAIEIKLVPVVFNRPYEARDFFFINSIVMSYFLPLLNLWLQKAKKMWEDSSPLIMFYPKGFKM